MCPKSLQLGSKLAIRSVEKSVPSAPLQLAKPNGNRVFIRFAASFSDTDINAHSGIIIQVNIDGVNATILTLSQYEQGHTFTFAEVGELVQFEWNLLSGFGTDVPAVLYVTEGVLTGESIP